MNKFYLSTVMKIIMLFLVVGFTTVSASTYSQQITLQGKNIPFSSVIDAIRQQSGYTVFGSKKVIESAKLVTIDVKNMPLQQFLEVVTKEQPLTYAVADKTISFSSVPLFQAPIEKAELRQLLSGIVRNAETKELLEGASISIKGNNTSSITNSKGQYSINIPASEKKQILVFRFIGMKTQEITYEKQTNLNIELEPNEDSMNEVVVTGIYQRDRESSTGSSVRISGKDLMVVGNQNVIQSLKTLDPSFAVIDNNLFGSDPNRLANIEIRGKSSIIGLTDEYGADPNQPLFILDGFESTLAIISDLSMDRVESITLLKDAAASAIYGSKAANGVVVIETKRPTPGQLRINYSLNGTVSFADLSDYNLMNAEEKLRFEYLSELYGLLDANQNLILGSNLANEAKYYDRLKEVKRGVNTYWPNEPLRTAVTQRHTLFAEGGDANLRYSASFNYGLTTGIMQGSDRQTTNGNLRLLYRKNRFSVNNSLSIDNVNANKESTPFSKFSRANPYHRKYDAQGNVNKVLEDFKVFNNSVDYSPIYSPLYDQSNTNVNVSETQGFTNNLEMEYRILESLRARGRFGIRNTTTTGEIFRSPFNVEFEETNALQKGKYNASNGKNVNLDGDFSLTFGKVFASKHSVNAVAGMRMEQATNNQSSYEVRGFMDEEFTNPNFALGFTEGQRVVYQESKRRGASFYINVGYSFNQRYNIEGTVRSDGSSVFGASKQFSNIWSLGTSWNLHKETFLKGINWIDQLRLRASIGNPGNQNFEDYISMRVYRYNIDNRNPFGASTIINNMGNKNLEWQTTLDRNVGLDFQTLDNRLRLTADYFVKSTDPLLVMLELPSSTGVARVARNIGEQITKGFTLSSNYAIIKNKSVNWSVNLNMRQLKSKFAKMGNALNNLNEGNQKLSTQNKSPLSSRNLVRYYDGGSPNDLWAVRSVGIDAATGREIFLNKNGEQTFVHDFKDEVVVGKSEPNLEGVIGTNFFYKGFTTSISLRYRIGGQEFMKTLYEKVENITLVGRALNQDRRALYDRWQKPGDNALFKAISATEITPMSSRFIQDNDMLIGEAISFGYENSTAKWLKTVRASSITFRVYMNDIFRISTIKNERGIDYPFARTVSFSAAVRF